MARQKGIIQIEGTVGNMTFFKSKDGYMVREKGGVSADKIATDPAFQRTRENMEEFKRAGKACKLLRTAFRSTIQKASDHRLVARLTRQMVAVIKEDAVNTRGQRNVIDGEVVLLDGFDFNVQSSLSATLFAPYTVTIDRVTGDVTLSMASFIPSGTIVAPAGTTHFNVTMAAGEIDFENSLFTVQSAVSGYIPWNSQPTTAITLTAQLPAASAHPLFAILTIEFVQDVNSVKYALNNGAFNAASIVKIDAP